MGSRFVRKVRTASGAVAVQIVEKSGRQVVGVEHVGSAHSDADLALLLVAAQERLMPGQATFDLGFVEQVPVSLADVADWTEPRAIPILEQPTTVGRPTRSVSAEGKVLGSPAAELWEVLLGAYSRLGFDVLDDEGFRAMVLARLIEPTSKADSIRVLDEIDAPHPALRTLFRSLQRCQEQDYRDLLAKAMVGFRTETTGLAAMIMYDVTTLHFQSKEEDKIRRVGESQRTPGGPANPGRTLGRSRRIPPRTPHVPGQQSRNHHDPSGAGSISRTARHHRHGRRRRCWDALGWQPASHRRCRIQIYRWLPLG